MTIRRLGSMTLVAVIASVGIAELHGQQVRMTGNVTMAARIRLANATVRVEPLADERVRLTLSGTSNERLIIDASAVEATPSADGLTVAVSGLAQLSMEPAAPKMTAEGPVITIGPDGAAFLTATQLTIVQ